MKITIAGSPGAPAAAFPFREERGDLIVFGTEGDFLDGVTVPGENGENRKMCNGNIEFDRWVWEKMGKPQNIVVILAPHDDGEAITFEHIENE